MFLDVLVLDLHGYGLTGVKDGLMYLHQSHVLFDKTDIQQSLPELNSLYPEARDQSWRILLQAETN